MTLRVSVKPLIINYVKQSADPITCYPILYRLPPASTEIMLDQSCGHYKTYVNFIQKSDEEKKQLITSFYWAALD